MAQLVTLGAKHSVAYLLTADRRGITGLLLQRVIVNLGDYPTAKDFKFRWWWVPYEPPYWHCESESEVG
jgi:hypothetical protein